MPDLGVDRAAGAATSHRQPRFTYLGPEGTFTEQALYTVPQAAAAQVVQAATAGEALAMVRSEAVDAAMLPMHNSVAGFVPDTLRAIAEGPRLAVVREVVLSIEFALLVRPSTSLGEVRTVSGHPHARPQVAAWLAAHLPRARWVAARSNAEAARLVRDGRHDAALAGEFAAQRYGLVAAATGLQDHPEAVTHFLLLARPDAPGLDGDCEGLHPSGRSDGTSMETGEGGGRSDPGRGD
ncbi:prephenate dehydratase domain-containing protein [Streptomyces sp. NRRL WC-3742]|uniref:prephenate dehydratase domain-containing protein n=1 Tax=Streptomyces sp. NRRL WC-3742 TaxID=1463934 RepID=UPI00068B2C69|nr:prephenate dehydratase domain-containing protein [Streptomyces sp. NRRL WC-3742]